MVSRDFELDDDQFAEILAHARSGSARALGDLLSLFRDYLKLIAYFELGEEKSSSGDASDVVQQTFLEAHRDFPQFAGTSVAEMRQWLLRILQHNLIDETRLRSRRERLGKTVPLDSGLFYGDQLVGNDPTASSKFRTAENAEQLRRLIQSLPPDYCQVIMLRHYSNLSFPEIGAAMGRSPDAVRKLWTRALEELQSRMRDQP